MAASENARKIRAAMIRSGNIGTEHVAKISRSPLLELVGLAGIDPASKGLARAKAQGVFTTHDGLNDLLESVPEIDVAFDATSAGAHEAHARLLAERGILSIDLTPAGLGPSVVPSVDLGEHLLSTRDNTDHVWCAGDLPIVAALSAVSTVAYAEVVSTVSARSAGPGTRQNIDSFTQTTAEALKTVGGATRGKAIIILNPPILPNSMRNTVYAEAAGIDADDAATAIEDAVKTVAALMFLATASGTHR